jgi:hypothetical protein
MGLFGQKHLGAVGTIFKTKENIMKWFKQWLYRMAADKELKATVQSARTGRNTLHSQTAGLSDIESDDGLNITVRPAIGGRIVTFRHYDRKTDRTSYKLYIVPEELNFENELGKMIMLESMR